MIFQAFKGDESSDHSNPGFVIVDGSRKGRGKILVKTHNIPAKDFEAGYRGGSIINTPAVDLEADAGLRRHRQPGQREAASDHQLAAQDRRRSRLEDVRQDPGLAIAAPRTATRLPQDVDSPTCQTDAAVAGRPLLVRAVRLQLPGVAEPVDQLRGAPDVRRPAEVGGVHRGLHRHDGSRRGRPRSGCRASAATSARPRSTRTGSTSP